MIGYAVASPDQTAANVRLDATLAPAAAADAAAVEGAMYLPAAFWTLA